MTAQTPRHGCPASARKTARPGEAAGPRVEVRDGTWHVRSLPMVRQLLREGRATVQAGFNAEHVADAGIRMPVLFLDGEEHRRQRSRIARFFAPATVSKRYRGFMEARADQLVAAARRQGEVDLSELTMRYSVEVAAQVVGLGDADMRGMSRRLEAFFATPFIAPGVDGQAPSRWSRLTMSLRGGASMLNFYLRDVRPAVRTRRRAPADDVITHLIGEGYRDREILTECVTYAAAGMVTTREFIQIAAWHLLEDRGLRARYVGGDRDERYAILQETLRLEPVVGHLFRRTTRPLVVRDGDEEYAIPVGALLDLDLRAANADAEHVGQRPLDLCPGRPMPDRVRPEATSFGDGAHKCPGQHIAIQESDILLSRLMRLPMTLTGAPRIGWDDLISGYEVRDLTVSFSDAA